MELVRVNVNLLSSTILSHHHVNLVHHHVLLAQAQHNVLLVLQNNIHCYLTVLAQMLVLLMIQFGIVPLNNVIPKLILPYSQ